MPQYMLLLHEPAVSNGGPPSPAEMQAIIERYKAWSGRLAQSGNLRGGEKLADGSGRVLRKDMAVHDGPYAESKEVIGGYFLIEAADYNEAARLSADCPHLEFGPVEIREIEKV